MARVSLLVTLFPLAAGLAYLVRPTEQRLALMRPISLAGIFSGLGGAVLGLMNVLRWYGIDNPAAVAAEHGDRRRRIAGDAVRGVRMPDGCVALRRAGDATESLAESREPRAGPSLETGFASATIFIEVRRAFLPCFHVGPRGISASRLSARSGSRGRSWPRLHGEYMRHGRRRPQRGRATSFCGGWIFLSRP